MPPRPRVILHNAASVGGRAPILAVEPIETAYGIGANMRADLLDWLMESGEPWTRYRTLLDLLGRSEEHADVQAARAQMLGHPQVRAMIGETSTWGDRALTRHNDAGHPIYKFSTLADFGVSAGDPGMAAGMQAVLSHHSAQGAFQTVLNIPTHFGGSGQDSWTWALCDAPTLLYALLAMGMAADERVCMAASHLADLVSDNGWHCVGAPEMGSFRGPGRKADPCPIANVYALKALALAAEHSDSHATRAGTEMLLGHWQRQRERKMYLFGVGTDFRKLKYPFVWYDVLHVVDVLSRFPFVHSDPRFQEMVAVITDQADAQGRYTAGSMYRAWKGWSFADKRNPSPWLTFLALRVSTRLSTAQG